MNTLHCPICGKQPQTVLVHNEFVTECLECNLSREVEMLLEEHSIDDDGMLEVSYTRDSSETSWNMMVLTYQYYFESVAA